MAKTESEAMVEGLLSDVYQVANRVLSDSGNPHHWELAGQVRDLLVAKFAERLGEGKVLSERTVQHLRDILSEDNPFKERRVLFVTKELARVGVLPPAVKTIEG